MRTAIGAQSSEFRKPGCPTLVAVVATGWVSTEAPELNNAAAQRAGGATQKKPSASTGAPNALAHWGGAALGAAANKIESRSSEFRKPGCPTLVAAVATGWVSTEAPELNNAAAQRAGGATQKKPSASTGAPNALAHWGGAALGAAANKIESRRDGAECGTNHARVLYQGATPQPSEKHSEDGALYQGMTPQPSEKHSETGALYQGAIPQPSEKHSEAGALYQGMTLVVPLRAPTNPGFSPCALAPQPGLATTLSSALCALSSVEEGLL